MQRLRIILLLLYAPGLCIANNSNPSGLPPAVHDSDYYNNGYFSTAQVRLGQMLFFDKILSGNKNIACATCHHPKHGTSDSVALSLGEGAVGLAKHRHTVAQHPVTGRVPRNAQALFNLGAKQFTHLFHDGRVERDPTLPWFNGYWTPAREQLPAGLNNVLAAQAMFPVTSHVEMAGQKGENEVANAVAAKDFRQAWRVLTSRLQAIREYVRLFKKAFPQIVDKQDIRFVDAANAIAAFETVAFRADNSPFDIFLRSGDPRVLSLQARRGMSLFYGRAGCVRCHSGKFQSDQSFHAIAMPQIGPGKNDGWDQSYWQATGRFQRMEDFGRGRITLRETDNFKFRTPSLRNITLTGPWGHAGTQQSLKSVIRQHLSPTQSLNRYRMAKHTLPPMDHVIEVRAHGSQLAFQVINPLHLADYRKQETWVIKTAGLRQRIADASELPPINMSNAAIEDLVAFLHALTDSASRNLTKWIPVRVPSGLTVDNEDL